MDYIIFPDKGTSEIVTLTVQFGDRLVYGESVVGSAVNVVVSSGVDTNPTAILSGASTHTANSISQLVTGGVPGVTYTLIFLAAGTASHTYVKQGYLAVLTPGTF